MILNIPLSETYTTSSSLTYFRNLDDWSSISKSKNENHFIRTIMRLYRDRRYKLNEKVINEFLSDNYSTNFLLMLNALPNEINKHFNIEKVSFDIFYNPEDDESHGVLRCNICTMKSVSDAFKGLTFLEDWLIQENRENLVLFNFNLTFD